MSLLTPLYIAGLLAISLPLVFHLIRRTPRGQRRFSSLMFLAASPPRLSRRNRLDNLLLLLLRALALTLMALAFARPFLRDAAYLALDARSGRQVAILLDTSASMRRGDLWQQALSEVEHVLAGLEPADDVTLVTFDRRTSTVVDLGYDPNVGAQAQNKPAIIRRRLGELGPTWEATDLGSALVTVAEALDLAVDSDRSDWRRQIVLVSDMQQGAKIESLQAYQWPTEVKVSVCRLSTGQPTNACVQVLLDQPSPSPDDPSRVRVTNAANSTRGEFQVRWAIDGNRPGSDHAMAVHVPPGQSRVVRLMPPTDDGPADRMVLTGDHDPFDNTFYVVPQWRQELTLLYVGNDEADDPNGLRYYLERALSDNARREVIVQGCGAGQPLPLSEQEPPSLTVVTEAISSDQTQQLKDYMQDGGTVLLVPKSRESAVSLVGFDKHVVVYSEDASPPSEGYAMLGEIDFSHPLFSAFATPQYNDFTQIHFWRHRRVLLGEGSPARVVARFDSGFPALWEQRHGSGRLFVLTSGWHPDDSQLALSSKFVPLLVGFLEEAGGGTQETDRYSVNDRVSLPARWDGKTVVHKPDGSQLTLARGDNVLADTDQPGLYRAERNDRVWRFAVNMAPRESNTADMDLQRLEQLGVPLGNQPTPTEHVERQRQLRDVELEGRQKLWRWLLVAALCVLTMETWLGGREPNKTPQAADTG